MPDAHHAPPPILVLSGGIASGKSSLAEAVANALGWPRSGFGEAVRREARRRGLGDQREELQRLGQELVDADPEGLCRSVLSAGGFEPGRGLVIDGVRHVAILERLKQLTSPAPVLLVFVETDTATREVRYRSRTGEADLALADAESHATEREVPEMLAARADLEVDGGESLDALVPRVIRIARREAP